MKRRRMQGLTFLELMIAMAVTALITMSLASVMHFVASAWVANDTVRELAVRTAVAEARLNAIMHASRCVLYSNPSQSLVALWANDNRSSGTVHLSELQYIALDVSRRELQLTKFEPAKPSDDLEFSRAADWSDIYASTTPGSTSVLLDNVSSFKGTPSSTPVLAARRVAYEIQFDLNGGSSPTVVELGFAYHQEPAEPVGFVN